LKTSPVQSLITPASYLAVLEGLWLATRKEVFHTPFKFWLPMFSARTFYLLRLMPRSPGAGIF